MLRTYLFFCLFFIALAGAKAQHYDELYSPPKGPAKTWRDSGYYFVPTLVRFNVLTIMPGNNPNQQAAAVVFYSTDNSGLTFMGQATFIFRPANLPVGVNIEEGVLGLATVLLPQDLLFCPDEEEEQGMGQDDPYLPLYSVGRYERIDAQWLNERVLLAIQLNEFVVN